MQRLVHKASPTLYSMKQKTEKQNVFPKVWPLSEALNCDYHYYYLSNIDFFLVCISLSMFSAFY